MLTMLFQSLIDTASDDGDEEVSEDSIVLPPRKKATLNDDIVTAFRGMQKSNVRHYFILFSISKIL